MFIIDMKHMTCVNHKEAQQVCLNADCKAACSYICFEAGDSCRDDHESCPAAFLAFLLRKSSKIVAKAHDLNIEKLISFHTTAQKVLESLTAFLESYHLLSSVKQVLDPHGMLEPKDKATINTFLSSSIKNEREVSIGGLEKDLSSLQLELTAYLTVLREERSRNEEVKGKRESNIKQSSIRSKMKPSNPSPVKSGLPSELIGLSSKLSEKAEEKGRKEEPRE